jgi:cysteine desulfurase
MRPKLVGDLLTISAHKMHGPKGVGALIVRRGVRVGRRMFGGGQEFHRRAGTENTAGILGMAKALELADRDMEARLALMNRLRERLR